MMVIKVKNFFLKDPDYAFIVRAKIRSELGKTNINTLWLEDYGLIYSEDLNDELKSYLYSRYNFIEDIRDVVDNIARMEL